MKTELTIRIAGEAGQGMQTIGAALCKIFKKCGSNIFANMDYMSRIRGGNNFFQLRVSDNPLYGLREKSDIIVALDKPSVELHKGSLTNEGIIVLDKKKFGISADTPDFFDAPIYEIAKNTAGSEIFVNSVSFGVIAGLTRVEFTMVSEVLKEIFSDKEETVINKNIECARFGYDLAINNFKRDIFKLGKVTKEPKSSLLMNGNDAIALGAIYAGCKFYSAYPMTPSTGIMNVIAHYAKEFNIAVEQAEDEIAAINMALGASFAGVRSMTGSSGGGFALMVEGVSLSGMTETPVVIVEAQRPAPATGFPTRTEQADLEFILHAGHGEFARVVLSPGSIEEAFYLTIKAFNISEKFQVPVFIMTDQYLADSYRNIDTFDLNAVKPRRYIISKEESINIKDYRRYELTESGISPRAIPSWIEDCIYADSDEHTQEGHITEDARIRIAMVEKRLYKKLNGLLGEIEKPVTSNSNNTELIVIGFGSTYGVIKETCKAIGNKKIGFIHLPQVWPFPSKNITDLLTNAKKIITVENNAGAQLAKLLRRETGIKADSSILKFDGRPFDLDYLAREIEARIKCSNSKI